MLAMIELNVNEIVIYFTEIYLLKLLIKEKDDCGLPVLESEWGLWTLKNQSLDRGKTRAKVPGYLNLTGLNIVAKARTSFLK